MHRTPYIDWSKDVEAISTKFKNHWKELSDEGYIFVLQHVRGRYGSQGEYVIYRGVRDREDPKSIDDSTDTFDTIEWLLHNVPDSNGKVGIIGVSNPGAIAALALIDPHPALRAVSPQGPASFQFTGDDFFHNGAFSLAPNYAYSQWSMWKPELDSEDEDLVGYAFDDRYEFFLRLGSLANVNKKYFNNEYGTWDLLTSHLTFDSFWKRREIDKHIQPTNIPTLVVGGYYDSQDQKGAFGVFEALKTSDKSHVVHLVVGPWLHGGWRDEGRRLGKLDFDTATGDVYRATIQAPFFSHHLKGKGDLDFGEALMFQTGTNR